MVIVTSPAVSLERCASPWCHQLNIYQGQFYTFMIDIKIAYKVRIHSLISDAFQKALYISNVYKILLLILLPVSSFAQKKGDTKIILNNTDFDKVTLALFENGYTIDNKDEKLKFISTKTKDLGSIGVRIRAIQKDSTITLSGEVVDRALMIVIRSSEPIYTPIQFGGMKGSTRRDSWNELAKLAKSAGSVIRYE